jgi:hypothetical protein
MMRWLAAPVGLGAILLAAPTSPAGAVQPGPRPVLVIAHVSIVDVAAHDPRQAVRPDQDVVIEGGRITSVGRKLAARRAARVIDGTGRYLIPGLWDMHVHALFEGRPEQFFPQMVANGVTGFREMSSTFSPDAIRAMRARLESGEILGPHVVAEAVRIVDGRSDSQSPGFEYVATPDEGRAIVRRRKEEGADFVKVYNLLPREVFFAMADEAKAQRLPMAGHVPFSVTAAEASDAGLVSIEHLTRVLWACSRREDEIRATIRPADGKPATGARAGLQGDAEAVDGYDPGKAAAFFSRLRRNGTASCPTLVQLRKFASSADPAFVADPRLRYVPRSVREDWEARRSGPLARALPFATRAYPHQLEVVRAMHEAGVTILAGTDAGWGNPYTYPGFSLHDELGCWSEPASRAWAPSAAPPWTPRASWACATASGRWSRARPPIWSCSMRTPSTTSPTRGGSPRSC